MPVQDAGKPTFTYVSPSDLRFDPTNPRFGGLRAGTGQDEIQALLEREPHFARELIDSFLENGFIDYEPLVVRRKADKFVVVEGNRRLAAIRLILGNRAEYESRSTRLDDLAKVPVLIFPARPGTQGKQEQRVYLGVRHLFGFREWPAESKARFLDANIRRKEDLDRMMRELNIKKTELRRYLVPYRLRAKAGSLWRPYKNQDFWVLGEGLNRTGIKEYVELDVDAASLTVKQFNSRRLRRLLQFIYGTPRDGKLVERRIRETRDLSTLARVLQSKRAAATLERGGSLEEAALFIQSSEESLDQLRRMLSELKLLLRKVLAKGLRGTDLEPTFAAFEAAAVRFLRNAKHSRV